MILDDVLTLANLQQQDIYRIDQTLGQQLNIARVAK